VLSELPETTDIKLGNGTYNKHGVKFERTILGDELDTVIAIPSSALRDGIPTVLVIDEIPVDRAKEGMEYDVLPDVDGKTSIRFATVKGKSPTTASIRKVNGEIIVTCRSNLASRMTSEDAGQSAVLKLEWVDDTDGYTTTKITLPSYVDKFTGGITLVIDGIKEINRLPTSTSVTVDLDKLPSSKGVTTTGIKYEIQPGSSNNQIVKIELPPHGIEATTKSSISPSKHLANSTFRKDGVVFERRNLGTKLDAVITIPRAIAEKHDPIILMEEVDIVQSPGAPDCNVFNNTDGIMTIEFTTPRGKSSSILTIEKDDKQIIATSTTNMTLATDVEKSAVTQLEIVKANGKYTMKITLPFTASVDVSELVLMLEGINDIDNVAPDTKVTLEESPSPKGKKSGITYEFLSQFQKQKILKIKLPTKGSLVPTTRAHFDKFRNGTYSKKGIDFSRVNSNGQVQTNVTIPNSAAKGYYGTVLVIDEQDVDSTEESKHYEVYDVNDKLNIKFTIPKSQVPTIITVQRDSSNILVRSTTNGSSSDMKTGNHESQMKFEIFALNGRNSAKITLPAVNKDARERIFTFEGIEGIDDLPTNTKEFIDLSSLKGETALGIAHEFLFNDTNKMLIEFVLPKDELKGIKSIKDLANFGTFDLGGKLVHNLTAPYQKDKSPNTALIIEENVNGSQPGQYDVFSTDDGKTIIKLSIPKGRSATVLTIGTDENQISVNASTSLMGDTPTEDVAAMELKTLNVDGRNISKITLPYSADGNGSVYIVEGLEKLDTISSEGVPESLLPLTSAAIEKKYKPLLNQSGKIIASFKIPTRKNETEDDRPTPTNFAEFVDAFVDAIGVGGTVVVVTGAVANVAILGLASLLLLHRFSNAKFLQAAGLNRACQTYEKITNS
ncbi:hypothetical protein PPYR_08672, partial [Photinus pyralis]